MSSLTRITPPSLIFPALRIRVSIARGSAARDVIKVLLKYNAQ